MSVSGPTSKRLDKRVPAHIRRSSPGGVLICDIQSDHGWREAWPAMGAGAGGLGPRLVDFLLAAPREPFFAHRLGGGHVRDVIVLLAGINELRGRLARGVLERARPPVDAVAVDAQDDAPAAGLDLDHEALEAGLVIVDPSTQTRLVRLHGVGCRREARHLCCCGLYMDSEPLRRRLRVSRP